MIDEAEHVSDRWHNAQAALRPAAGVGEIQVVGALSDSTAVQLGLLTRVRTVFLHPDVVQHIVVQRELGEGDAEFVLEHMPDTVMRPHYLGRDPRQNDRFDLVYLAPPTGRALVVAIKFVSASAARSQYDELWVSTGYPLGTDFLKRRRWRASLIPALSVNP